MNNYVEILVKRNVKDEKKKRKLFAFTSMALMFVLWIATTSSVFCVGLILSLLGYYFFVQNYFVEFEYFYMDEELTISKIINKSRRKKILELNDGEIKLIAPVGSAELQEFYDLKKIDCTENEPLNLPYVIVYEHHGALKAVNIQMTKELYKELKRNMPNKVKLN